MTHKRLRKLLQATGIQRNNVEDVIRKYREDYFYTTNEKDIDYESLLRFVQDNPNAGISLTISENEFDQVIETIISALITNETPPTQLVSYLEYRTHHIYIEFVNEATLEINTIEG